MTREAHGLEYAGHIQGVLPQGTSVYTGEAFAIKHLLSIATGCVECTTDCLGVHQTLTKSGKLPSVWKDVTAEVPRLQLTWVNSHLSEEAFAETFGREQLWRRQINQEADAKCVIPEMVDRARQHANKIKRLDQLVLEVSSFLSERTMVLLKRSKSDPPPWCIQDGKKVQKPNPTFRKHGEPAHPFEPSGAGGTQVLNKKQRLLRHVEEPSSHQWLVTSKVKLPTCA
jgi:hypothetical protein